MAKRLLKTMILPLTVLAAAVAFIACDGTAPDVKYKVTYVIGENAEGAAPTETDKAAGEKFKLKSADCITSEGATFTGWSDGSLTYQVGDTYTMPSKAVTFTAQWQPNGTPATYSVTYDLNGGTGETPAISYKGATETFTLASADGFSYEGKEFDGWSDGENKYDAGAEYTMSGKEVVFTAQWKDDEIPVMCTVTYKAGEHGTGEDVVISNVPSGTYSIESGFPFVVENFYRFNGWKAEDDDAASNRLLYAGNTYTLTGDTIFVAQYENAYKAQDNDRTSRIDLDFKTHEGSLYILNLSENSLEYVALTFSIQGSTITITPAIGTTCTGTFINNVLNIAITVKGKTYTYGNLSAAVQHSVTIVKSSNSSLESSVVGTVPAIGKKAEGEKFTMPQGALTLPHYTLSVWRVQKYVIPEVGEAYWDTVQSYQPDEEIEMPAFNIQIVAVWVANEVTISFDANGGTGATMTPVKQNFGTNMALETAQKFACTYTAPTGKEFAGWSTTPNGAALGNGTKLDGNIVGADDTVTLYALWETSTEPANPIAALVGSWTNGTDTLIISANKVNEYMQGSAIYNGNLCNVYIDGEYDSIMSLDYTEYYNLSYTDSSLTLTDDEGEVIAAFTTKTAVTESSVSEFVGKWARSGTNQPWIITQEKVYYGTNLSEANMVIIGDYCALYYEIGYNTYVYVMQKDGNTLTGYMGATAVTFNAGTYSLLTVNGVLNQVVNSGAAPDASKITTPTAPEGKEFAGWVLAGTETAFDVTAVMTADASITATFSDIVVSGNAKTYSGTVGSGFLAKTVTITIDFDTLECTVVYGNNSPESCVLELKTEGYFFSANTSLCDDEPLWIIVSEDGNTIEAWDDFNGPYDKKATLTLQA